ncbi:Lysosomal protein NCU-G1-B [Paragonimus heterotremus]|uniref:Lysosomal protein NCU-G1-B n=1 Tax=Paragonimus heterotremus TaxID=100268 RepID=A0A8J4SZV7_9TREM|nr:Lysosomal protein NCU-G1-B [Paragonimus heterotremus]
MSKVPANEDFYKVHLLNEWSWKLTTPLDAQPHTIDGNHIFEVIFEGNNTDTVCANDGHVELKFAISAMEQRNPRMPRLKFVRGLSTQFEFAMASLHTNFIRGRFGLQLLFVSNESVIPGEDFRLESLFSINDEVTPGIFEMVNIKLGERDNSTTSTLKSHSNTPQSSWPTGFIQARPVCYTSERYREVKASRDAKLSKQRTVLNTSDQELLLPRTLPYLFYAQRIKPTDDPHEVVGMRLQNISFGTPGDGYYAHSSFIVWTISFGFGEPPIDTLSPLLIGLITLSAVVVLGSLLFGTMLILIFQRRYRFGEFQRLTETDTTSAVST